MTRGDTGGGHNRLGSIRKRHLFRLAARPDDLGIVPCWDVVSAAAGGAHVTCWRAGAEVRQCPPSVYIVHARPHTHTPSLAGQKPGRRRVLPPTTQVRRVSPPTPSDSADSAKRWGSARSAPPPADPHFPSPRYACCEYSRVRRVGRPLGEARTITRRTVGRRPGGGRGHCESRPPPGGGPGARQMRIV